MNEINDIIDAIIIPFVVERPYEVSGDFYMSSSNINKIETMKDNVQLKANEKIEKDNKYEN